MLLTAVEIFLPVHFIDMSNVKSVLENHTQYEGTGTTPDSLFHPKTLIDVDYLPGPGFGWTRFLKKAGALSGL